MANGETIPENENDSPVVFDPTKEAMPETESLPAVELSIIIQLLNKIVSSIDRYFEIADKKDIRKNKTDRLSIIKDSEFLNNLLAMEKTKDDINSKKDSILIKAFGWVIVALLITIVIFVFIGKETKDIFTLTILIISFFYTLIMREPQNIVYKILDKVTKTIKNQNVG